MVSYFDPFSYSCTSMDSLIRYAGKRSMNILNFMVKQFYQNKKRNRTTEKNVFGTTEYENYLTQNFDSLEDTKKIKAYLEAYKKSFKDKYKQIRNNEAIRLLELSLKNVYRKENSEKCLYYLLFAAMDLTTMANVKYGVHVVAQNFKLDLSGGNADECELFFSDNYYNPEIPWRPEKSCELVNKEATCIYNKFRGKTVSFGQVKEWVLMETLFQIHSAALRYLEKNQFLVVDDTEYLRLPGVPKYERTNNAFPTHVGKYNDSKDWDKKLKIKYYNGWVLRFIDKGERNF